MSSAKKENCSCGCAGPSGNGVGIGATGSTGDALLCVDCSTSSTEVCALAFLGYSDAVIGTGTNPGDLTLSFPKGFNFNPDRIEGAVQKAQSQLPTGSFSGYLDKVFFSVGSSAGEALEESFKVAVFGVVALIFIHYCILLIVLVAGKTINAGLAAVLIFAGLTVSLIGVFIILSEVSRFASRAKDVVESESAGVVDNLTCALSSGLCCYTGANCCCADGDATVPCKNPAPPPP